MHHVCLVSDQQIPNFLPMLNSELKPSKVTLVVTEAMEKKEKVKALKDEIAKRNIPIGDDIWVSNPNDISSIWDTVFNWLADNNGEDVVLNVTGGTKPMAIAAQEVFRAENKPVFYVDINSDRVLWIGNKRPEIQLKETSLKLRTLLSLNGVSIVEGDYRSSVRNEEWRKFSERLAKENKLHTALGRLNLYASIARSQKKVKVSCDPPIEHHLFATWNEMVGLLKDNGLIKDGSDKFIEFVNGDARDFCNGGWLEHHVFEKIKKFGISKDYALMNAVVRYANGSENELDAAVVVKNKLIAIECKSKNMKRDDVVDSAVYKLADISQHLGGLRVKSILVSCRPIREEDRKRAKLLKVDVIDRLSILEDELKRLLEIA